ncbi:hypothetical protein ABZW03_05495 [Kitasatospora sp. NPDC004799]|uniref:hypothetical protein n=1 Tax=Kitasatospora sp. NPDC004799 TaxID=3154460 RepID=UPI0033A66D9B
MTSLHPAVTDPSLPVPPGDSAGSSPPPAEAGPPAAAVPVCSIATAAEPGAAAPGTPEGAVRQGGAPRHDSVPQPRSRYDAEAPPGPPVPPGPPAPGPEADGDPTGGDPTTARLRAAFTDRLRAAHARGRSVAELAEACRRPVAEVRALLGGDANAEADTDTDAEAVGGPTVPGASTGRAAAAPDTLGGPDGGGAEAGFVRFGSAAAPSDGGPSVPAPRPVREESRILVSRRPSPSRRLRRMHPQTAQTGQEATARETAASGPTGTGLPGPSGWPDSPAGAAGAPARVPSFGAGTGTGVGGSDPTGVFATAPSAGAAWAEPPLGILIGGSSEPAEASGRPEERAPVRVVARAIRVGRGTCLVVLPSWRPAIAVSVSTDQLLSATGLGFEQLVGARLTVLMNPAALHDRELELHGWEPAPPGRPRRGRSA